VSEGRARPKTPTKSWLIRCWAEPREQEPAGDPVHRFSIRDLETGEQRYVTDPRELSDLVTPRVREPGKTEPKPEQENKRTKG
jgi:hypothetical protein